MCFFIKLLESLLAFELLKCYFNFDVDVIVGQDSQVDEIVKEMLLLHFVFP